MIPPIAPYRITNDMLPTNTTTWVPDRDKAALLVHDMQDYFVGAFERAPGSAIDLAVSNTAQLLKRARAENQPVFYTAQPPAQSPEDRALLTDFWGTGLADADQAAILAELAPQPGEVVLTKWRYCAFYRTDLEERLRCLGKTQLWITGVYSHIGCQTTALNAFMKGFQVFFVADAQADFSADYHRSALAYVASRCGQVATTVELVR